MPLLIKSLETRHCTDDHSSALSMLLFSLKFGAYPFDKYAQKCITVTFEYLHGHTKYFPLIVG